MDVGGGGIRSDINVTPLVDVVLVLLIIFMVVTPMITRGYDLEVPQKVEDVVIPDEILADQLIVTYTAQEGIFINKDRVTRDNLATTLQSIITGRRKKSVFFAAARELNYGEVVQVLDIVRNSGAESIGLVTDDALALPPEQQSAAAAAEPSGQLPPGVDSRADGPSQRHSLVFRPPSLINTDLASPLERVWAAPGRSSPPGCGKGITRLL